MILSSRNSRCDEHGAALPIVLVIIAGLALILTAAYRAVSVSSDGMRELQSNALASQALFSAEQQALFVFLTGQATPRGLYLGEPVNSDEILFEDFDFSTLQGNALWSAGGGVRKSSNTVAPVLIKYWDGSAFPSFARMTPETSKIIFQAIGVSNDRSELLAARIADYQDSDVVRRFRGAERSDYRLAKLPPPTNAPLRNFEEVLSVLGVGEILSDQQRLKLRARVSFSPEYVELRQSFIDPSFRVVVEADRQGEIADSNRLSDETPSRRARFTITSFVEGDGFVRVVEIYRSANGAGAPFRRYLVSEEKNLNGPVITSEEWDGYADVF